MTISLRNVPPERILPASSSFPGDSQTGNRNADNPARPAADGRESGYILLSVLVMVAMMLLALSVAAPKMAEDIRRDRDQETIQRGRQYIRAIRLYYKRFGKYPDTIEELENTNQKRYLRKRYPDPETGKDDWRIIHLGEAKIPPMGMFGQPVGLASTPATGQSTANAGAVGMQATATAQANPYQGADQAATSGTQPTDGNRTGIVVSMGQIVGIGVPLDKASIKAVKGQNNYSRWEFVYSPAEDTVGVMSAGGPGTGPNGTQTPPSSTPQAPTNGSNGSNPPVGDAPVTNNPVP